MYGQLELIHEDQRLVDTMEAIKRLRKDMLWWMSKATEKEDVLDFHTFSMLDSALAFALYRFEAKSKAHC